jgi:hypothetical protein
MHLTRTGYNVLVIIWLAPLVVLDFIGNTLTTGSQSDMFYYKTMVDGLLIAYALYQCFRPATGSASTVHARIADTHDEVVGFEKLGAAEYLYCAILTLYAAGNWYFMHMINRESTGIVSIATLAWSFLSLAIALLSAVQFYHLKSGAIVELKHRIVQ